MVARASVLPLRGDVYRPLLLAALVVTFCVLGLGAYVRLTDAGLGCPDWPGCYGQILGVPDSAADLGRAWREMIHRYLAGILGLLILGLAVAAWRRLKPSVPWLATGLCGLVALQALLGMWTVTELLKPSVVTAHLLGGMLTWTILVVLGRREFAASRPAKLPRIGHWAMAAVLVQIALGGWVSSHYAGLACPDFPTCHGNWWPADLAETIQWNHRLGALAVLLLAGGYALALLRRPACRRFGIAIALALSVQLALGVANIWLQLPLPLAVAHNLGAAVLLATIVASITGRYE